MQLTDTKIIRMIRKLIAVLIACMFTISALTAQDKGIKFEQGLSWQQVKEKAKAENKYIFLDCYATWCGPCKAMDSDIYPSENVAAVMNDKFIAVKVQFDKSRKDSKEIQAWYEDAHNIQKEYKITGLPSFLFFSPDGKIVHRDMGYKDEPVFINLLTDALNPSRQYYTLLTNYRQGKKDYTRMKELAVAVNDFGDKEFSHIIAADYKKNYLDKLTTGQLLNKEHIDFINKYPDLLHSKDKFFQLFYHQAEQVDKICNHQGLSDGLVKSVITKEEIEKKLWQGNKPVTKKPDWQKISAAIDKKYNHSYTESVVPDAQISFYRRIEDWPRYVKLKDHKRDQHTVTDAGDLNGDAWDIFLHCNDKSILSKALAWSDKSLQLAMSTEGNEYAIMQAYDTNANLLYKLGRVEEALVTEQKAIATGISLAQKNGVKKGYFFDEFSATLAKMKKGEPTWSTN
jgi:thioredoxin-related protein